MFTHNSSAYFPVVYINCVGNISKTNKKPNKSPQPTDKKKLPFGALVFQNKNVGVNPITIVPLMVVADKISASKNMGNVPSKATAIITQRPKDILELHPKSIANNFAEDANVESNVEAAEVIIIKLMTNTITVPKALLTATAACP